MDNDKKIWEGSGATTLMRVISADASGVTVEYNWTGKVKGQGRAEGVDGTITFTGTKLAQKSGYGSGITEGAGILFTKKDMVVIKSRGYGDPRREKDKSVELWTFTTASKELGWLNDTVAIATQQGDPAWKQFILTVVEK